MFTPFAFVLRLVKIVALLLVSLWLPATLHCRLEALGFEGLFSCPQPSSSAAQHAGEGDCDRDSCQSVESGQFTFSQSRIAPALLPSPVCAFVHCLLHVALIADGTEIIPGRQTEPLPLQRNWQFIRRAALPARAPDVLNT